MEFPLEIKMLINDYLRPMTRPDWRQGSFITRHYRSPKGRYGRLLFDEFELYIIKCSKIDTQDGLFPEDTIKSWAFHFEHRYIKDDKRIVKMREYEYEREREHEDDDYDY